MPTTAFNLRDSELVVEQLIPKNYYLFSNVAP